MSDIILSVASKVGSTKSEVKHTQPASAPRASSPAPHGSIKSKLPLKSKVSPDERIASNQKPLNRGVASSGNRSVHRESTQRIRPQSNPTAPTSQSAEFTQRPPPHYLARRQVPLPPNPKPGRRKIISDSEAIYEGGQTKTARQAMMARHGIAAVPYPRQQRLPRPSKNSVIPHEGPIC